MGYRITVIFRKDDDNPWPWSDDSVLQSPEIANVIETWGANHPLYGKILDAAKTQSNTKEFRLYQDCDSAEDANRLLITMMNMPEKDRVIQNFIRSWMTENAQTRGYKNWRSEVITEEV